MPVLSNPKHEKFAQLIARGMSAIKAYQTIGYSKNTGNACTLRNKPHIKLRIDELKNSPDARMIELDDYLQETGLNDTYIIKQMLETALEAKKDGKYKEALEAFKTLGADLFGLFNNGASHKELLNNEQLKYKAAAGLPSLAGAIADLARITDSSKEETITLDIDSITKTIDGEITEYVSIER